MALSPRTVLIPLAASGSDQGRIARIQADDRRPIYGDSGLNPQIAELSDWNLYEAGAIALGAVRRLGLRARRLNLAQRLRPGIVSGYLTAINGPDLRGLAPENASSAELGLALGLLMRAAQCRDRTVIATGCLARGISLDSGPSDDVAVEPVGEISKKLEAVRRTLDTHKGGAYAPRVPFFLPKRTVDGHSTLAVHADHLRSLREAFHARDIEIEFLAVSTLREALVELGISRLETTAADRIVAGAFAATLMAAILLLGFYRWLIAPLDLAFAPISLSTGEEVVSPMRAIYDKQDGVFRLRPACLGEQRISTYTVGESLAFRAIIKSHSSLAQMLGGYHFTVVGVSEQSGVKVYPPETLRAIGPTPFNSGSGTTRNSEDFDLTAVVPVVGPNEKSKLIVLVRRLRPFDTKEIHDFLTTALAGVQPVQRINTVVTRLAGYAPGYVDYSFQSVERDTECAPS